jgi:hypothetical protein
VVHVPTCIAIYINAGGTDETRTIMRAELVAIFTALNKFATHEWCGSLRTPSPAYITSGTNTQTKGLAVLNTINTTCSY